MIDKKLTDKIDIKYIIGAIIAVIIAYEILMPTNVQIQIENGTQVGLKGGEFDVCGKNEKVGPLAPGLSVTIESSYYIFKKCYTYDAKIMLKDGRTLVAKSPIYKKTLLHVNDDELVSTHKKE